MIDVSVPVVAQFALPDYYLRPQQDRRPAIKQANEQRRCLIVLCYRKPRRLLPI